MRKPTKGRISRALYDSEITTKLWLAMLTQIAPLADASQIPFAIMQKLSKVPKDKIQSFLDDKLRR